MSDLEGGRRSPGDNDEINQVMERATIFAAEKTRREEWGEDCANRG